MAFLLLKQIEEYYILKYEQRFQGIDQSKRELPSLKFKIQMKVNGIVNSQHRDRYILVRVRL